MIFLSSIYIPNFKQCKWSQKFKQWGFLCPQNIEGGFFYGLAKKGGVFNSGVFYGGFL